MTSRFGRRSLSFFFPPTERHHVPVTFLFFSLPLSRSDRLARCFLSPPFFSLSSFYTGTLVVFFSLSTPRVLQALAGMARSLFPLSRAIGGMRDDAIVSLFLFSVLDHESKPRSVTLFFLSSDLVNRGRKPASPLFPFSSIDSRRGRRTSSLAFLPLFSSPICVFDSGPSRIRRGPPAFFPGCSPHSR